MALGPRQSGRKFTLGDLVWDRYGVEEKIEPITPGCCDSGMAVVPSVVAQIIQLLSWHLPFERRSLDDLGILADSKRRRCICVFLNNTTFRVLCVEPTSC